MIDTHSRLEYDISSWKIVSHYIKKWYHIKADARSMFESILNQNIFVSYEL